LDVQGEEREKFCEIKWLAFLNTVRTEHFAQVLELREVFPLVVKAA